jgi:hypothetical protein
MRKLKRNTYFVLLLLPAEGNTCSTISAGAKRIALTTSETPHLPQSLTAADHDHILPQDFSSSTPKTPLSRSASKQTDLPAPKDASIACHVNDASTRRTTKHETSNQRDGGNLSLSLEAASKTQKKRRVTRGEKQASEHALEDANLHTTLDETDVVKVKATEKAETKTQHDNLPLTTAVLVSPDTKEGPKDAPAPTKKQHTSVPWRTSRITRKQQFLTTSNEGKSMQRDLKKELNSQVPESSKAEEHHTLDEAISVLTNVPADVAVHASQTQMKLVHQNINQTVLSDSVGMDAPALAVQAEVSGHPSLNLVVSHALGKEDRPVLASISQLKQGFKVVEHHAKRTSTKQMNQATTSQHTVSSESSGQPDTLLTMAETAKLESVDLIMTSCLRTEETLVLDSSLASNEAPALVEVKPSVEQGAHLHQTTVQTVPAEYLSEHVSLLDLQKDVSQASETMVPKQSSTVQEQPAVGSSLVVTGMQANASQAQTEHMHQFLDQTVLSESVTQLTSADTMKEVIDSAIVNVVSSQSFRTEELPGFESSSPSSKRASDIEVYASELQTQQISRTTGQTVPIDTLGGQHGLLTVLGAEHQASTDVVIHQPLSTQDEQSVLDSSSASIEIGSGMQVHASLAQTQSIYQTTDQTVPVESVTQLATLLAMKEATDQASVLMTISESLEAQDQPILDSSSITSAPITADEAHASQLQTEQTSYATDQPVLSESTGAQPASLLVQAAVDFASVDVAVCQPIGTREQPVLESSSVSMDLSRNFEVLASKTQTAHIYQTTDLIVPSESLGEHTSEFLGKETLDKISVDLAISRALKAQEQPVLDSTLVNRTVSNEIEANASQTQMEHMHQTSHQMVPSECIIPHIPAEAVNAALDKASLNIVSCHSFKTKEQPVLESSSIQLESSSAVATHASQSQIQQIYHTTDIMVPSEVVGRQPELLTVLQSSDQATVDLAVSQPLCTEEQPALDSSLLSLEASRGDEITASQAQTEHLHQTTNQVVPSETFDMPVPPLDLQEALNKASVNVTTSLSLKSEEQPIFDSSSLNTESQPLLEVHASHSQSQLIAVNMDQPLVSEALGRQPDLLKVRDAADQASMDVVICQYLSTQEQRVLDSNMGSTEPVASVMIQHASIAKAKHSHQTTCQTVPSETLGKGIEALPALSARNQASVNMVISQSFQVQDQPALDSNLVTATVPTAMEAHATQARNEHIHQTSDQTVPSESVELYMAVNASNEASDQALVNVVSCQFFRTEERPVVESSPLFSEFPSGMEAHASQSKTQHVSHTTDLTIPSDALGGQPELVTGLGAGDQVSVNLALSQPLLTSEQPVLESSLVLRDVHTCASEAKASPCHTEHLYQTTSQTLSSESFGMPVPALGVQAASSDQPDVNIVICQPLQTEEQSFLDSSQVSTEFRSDIKVCASPAQTACTYQTTDQIVPAESVSQHSHVLAREEHLDNASTNMVISQSFEAQEQPVLDSSLLSEAKTSRDVETQANRAQTARMHQTTSQTLPLESLGKYTSVFAVHEDLDQALVSMDISHSLKAEEHPVFDSSSFDMAEALVEHKAHASHSQTQCSSLTTEHMVPSEVISGRPALLIAEAAGGQASVGVVACQSLWTQDQPVLDSTLVSTEPCSSVEVLASRTQAEHLHQTTDHTVSSETLGKGISALEALVTNDQASVNMVTSQSLEAQEQPVLHSTSVTAKVVEGIVAHASQAQKTIIYQTTDQTVPAESLGQDVAVLTSAEPLDKAFVDIVISQSLEAEEQRVFDSSSFGTEVSAGLHAHASCSQRQHTSLTTDEMVPSDATFEQPALLPVPCAEDQASVQLVLSQPLCSEEQPIIDSSSEPTDVSPVVEVRQASRVHAEHLHQTTHQTVPSESLSLCVPDMQTQETTDRASVNMVISQSWTAEEQPILQSVSVPAEVTSGVEVIGRETQTEHIHQTTNVTVYSESIGRELQLSSTQQPHEEPAVSLITSQHLYTKEQPSLASSSLSIEAHLRDEAQARQSQMDLTPLITEQTVASDCLNQLFEDRTMASSATQYILPFTATTKEQTDSLQSCVLSALDQRTQSKQTAMGVTSAQDAVPVSGEVVVLEQSTEILKEPQQQDKALAGVVRGDLTAATTWKDDVLINPAKTSAHIRAAQETATVGFVAKHTPHRQQIVLDHSIEDVNFNPTLPHPLPQLQERPHLVTSFTSCHQETHTADAYTALEKEKEEELTSSFALHCSSNQKVTITEQVGVETTGDFFTHGTEAQESNDGQTVGTHLRAPEALETHTAECVSTVLEAEEVPSERRAIVSCETPQVTTMEEEQQVLLTAEPHHEDKRDRFAAYVIPSTTEERNSFCGVEVPFVLELADHLGRDIVRRTHLEPTLTDEPHLVTEYTPTLEHEGEISQATLGSSTATINFVPHSTYQLSTPVPEGTSPSDLSLSNKELCKSKSQVAFARLLKALECEEDVPLTDLDKYSALHIMPKGLQICVRKEESHLTKLLPEARAVTEGLNKKTAEELHGLVEATIRVGELYIPNVSGPSVLISASEEPIIAPYTATTTVQQPTVMVAASQQSVNRFEMHSSTLNSMEDFLDAETVEMKPVDSAADAQQVAFDQVAIDVCRAVPDVHSSVNTDNVLAVDIEAEGLELVEVYIEHKQSETQEIEISCPEPQLADILLHSEHGATIEYTGGDMTYKQQIRVTAVDSTVLQSELHTSLSKTFSPSLTSTCESHSF